MGRWTERLKEKQRVEQKAYSEIPVPSRSLDYLLQLRLSELSKRNIALKIYSEVLGCEIWLCGIEAMDDQLMKDNPEAVIYTVDELRRLYRLKPSLKDLGAIHSAKAVFDGSKIMDSTLIRGDGDESDRR